MDFHQRFLRIYGLFDWLISSLVWSIFFYLRKYLLINDITVQEAIIEDSMYWTGIMVIPMCWSMLFFISGSYKPLYKQSVAMIFMATFWSVLSGSLGLLFLVFYDDLTLSQFSFVRSFVIFFCMALVAHTVSRVILFLLYKTILRAGNQTLSIIKIEPSGAVTDELVQSRYSIIAECTIDKLDKQLLVGDDYQEIIFEQLGLEEVKTLLQLSPFIKQHVNIRAMEVSDEARLSHVDISYDTDSDSLVIDLDRMNCWQRNIKRLSDVIISIVGLVICFPIVCVIAILIKLNSKGPIIYHQERVGKGLERFSIYKFRSMYQASEPNGPELSRDGDTRITWIGAYLRKYHIDEIPQFVNVILGHMSIVGPRPERPYYVDQILSENDQLQRLYSVRPGITSWGQVKYGYASTIHEILNRTRFDLLYLDNRSLYLDFRIILSTVRVVLFGKNGIK